MSTFIITKRNQHPGLTDRLIYNRRKKSWQWNVCDQCKYKTIGGACRTLDKMERDGLVEFNTISATGKDDPIVYNTEFFQNGGRA